MWYVVPSVAETHWTACHWTLHSSWLFLFPGRYQSMMCAYEHLTMLIPLGSNTKAFQSPPSSLFNTSVFRKSVMKNVFVWGLSLSKIRYLYWYRHSQLKVTFNDYTEIWSVFKSDMLSDLKLRLHKQSGFSAEDWVHACVASGLSCIQKPRLPAPVLGGVPMLQLRIFQLLCWPLPEYCHKLLMEDFLQKKAQTQSANKINVCHRNGWFALTSVLKVEK